MCQTPAVGPDALIARLQAIPELRMRARLLVAALADGPPAPWIDRLAELVVRAHAGADLGAAIAVEALVHATRDDALPYARRQALYEAAAARGRGALARLLLVAPPATTDLEAAGQERALRPGDRPLTLGERKSVARGHRRDLLALLLRDPHPDVVGILLDNPHLTEADVLRIAAARPAAPAALVLVAIHPRWTVRPAIKRAVALNPATPLLDAIRVATTLRHAELAQLAIDGSLREPLRAHAAELLADADAMLRRGPGN